jgi:hypothetical protein
VSDPEPESDPEPKSKLDPASSLEAGAAALARTVQGGPGLAGRRSGIVASRPW